MGRRVFLRLTVLAAGGLAGYEVQTKYKALGRFLKASEGTVKFVDFVGSEKSKSYFVSGKRDLESVEVELSELEYDTFQKINEARVQNGLTALELDDTLTRVARIRCADMVLRDYFSHESPQEFSFDDLLTDANYFKGLAGENLARNNYPYDSAVDVAVHDWMQSPGHRMNILTKEYNRIGIGVSKVQGMFGNRDGYLFTNIFLVYPSNRGSGRLDSV